MITLWNKLRWLFRRPAKEDDLRDELEFHLAEETEEREAAGLTAAQARRAAALDLGNVTLVRENTRAAWTWRYLDEFIQDCRYALRAMNANLTFTTLAVLSLALGIGANTAIYSFMDFILLRSLPVPDPASLVLVNWHNTVRMRNTVIHGGSGDIHSEKSGDSTGGIFPYPWFEVLQNSGSIFSSAFAYYPTRKINLMVDGQAEQASGEFVSGDYFRGLGVTPAVGRTITSDDDRFGAPAIVVLSYTYARRRFGDAAAALGQTVLINNIPITVAGVARPGFSGVDPAAAPDFYVPFHMNVLLNLEGGADQAKDYLDEHYYWVEMMARLRPGVTLQQAQAAMAPIFHQWVASTASTDYERAHLPALLLREGATGVDNLQYLYSKPLYVLLAVVGLILLIACANIANLLLARAAARQREMAVRLSLGAGRFRLIRQLLTESVLLACAGGILGVLLAIWGIRFLTLLLANGRDDFTLRPGLNWHVLAAAFGLSILTGIVFGLAPALQSTRASLAASLKNTRIGSSASRQALSRVLVVIQIAFSLLLLVGAGLFLRTLSNLQSTELGFQRDNLLLFEMNAHQAGHRDPEIINFYTSLLQSFRAIPGVITASATHYPMIGAGTWMGSVVPAGEKLNELTTHILQAAPGFFSTMQIPIVLGRAFDERDRPGSQQVAVVNQEYVRLNFRDGNPIGRHVVIYRRKPFGNQDVEIVGVARNARYGPPRGEFQPILYLPFNQGSYYPVERMVFVLRTAGDPLSYTAAIRNIARRADPRVPVTGIKTEAAAIDSTMNQAIIFARLCTAFAILALVIACVGLYGSMAYAVARRTSEIGLRMALGAQRTAVVGIVLREVVILAAIGLAISIPAALSVSKLVESFLFGVKPNDPRVIETAAAILTAAALVAGYLPARRASRIDPVTALRYE